MDAKRAEKLHIIDGNGYIYRAYYAHANLTTQAGSPTGAIFGFVQMLRRFLATSPSHVAVAFDAGRETFRTEIYPEYKANRAQRPDDLVQQMPRIRDVVRAFEIPVFERVGIEADDLIATLAQKAVDAGLSVVVVSSDKDLMQIIEDGSVEMLDPMKDKVYTEASVVERFMVPPARVVDVLALAGDTSDNVPGVPGVGEKTAGKLIAEFGSLDAVLDNVDKISGPKRRQNLIDFRQQALMSRDLVRLRRDCDVDLDLDALLYSGPDISALRALYAEFEFHTLLASLDREQTKERRPPAPAPKAYRVLEGVEELVGAVDEIRQAGRVAIASVLAGDDPLSADLVGLALSWRGHEAVYVPVGHRYIGAPRQVAADELLRHLGPVLADPKIGLIAHDLKALWLTFARLGADLRGVLGDTLLMSYLIDAGETSHTLDALAARQLRLPEDSGAGRSKLQDADMVDVEQAMAWAAREADLTLILYDWLKVQIDEQALGPLLDDLELPLSVVLARMQQRGILLDLGLLRELSDEFATELVDLERQIFEAAGHEFNVGSSKQLATVLFDELDLPSSKKTKSGLSTDQSVLEGLRAKHPLPGLVLEHRSFAKLKSTYVDALPALADASGRVHTDFNQAVAATGRLSSSNPNLQNIPIRTARGRRIRQAFIAPDGFKLVAADYSQIELRVVAHLSGDKTLISAFESGEDIHRRTASEIFDVPPLLVTPDQRRAAKTINFGVIYGMGATRLARDLEIPRSEASRFIETYFGRYPGVKIFFDKLLTDARRDGHSTTIMGRRRPIPELLSPRRNLRALGERLAVNTPIQGSAADIIKLAMLAVDRRIEAEGWGARMLLQVHDELVFEVEAEAASSFCELVRREMSAAIELAVPLVVDAAVGDNWLDAK